MRRLGAVPCGDGTAEVCVWAPSCEHVAIRADEEAKVLRLRPGDVTLVADFGNRRVEFSH